MSLVGAGRAICTKTNIVPRFSKESDSNSDSSAVISEVVNLLPDEV